MSVASLDTVLHHIRRMTAPQVPTDGQLLRHFVSCRDGAAFAELVRRHGPLVLGVCRRLLADAHDADDAFQATFLVLIRRAAALDGSNSLGPWLYGVARRTALKARAAALRRNARQTEVHDMPAPEAADALERRELRHVLEEELDGLPEKYRTPLVLCYLQGYTHEQAAHALGRPAGSMSRHVGRALELLRGRLVRRGAVLTTGVLSAALANDLAAGPVPTVLAGATVRAALAVASGGAAAASVVALADSVACELVGSRVKIVTALLVSLVVAVGGAGLVAQSAPPPPASVPESEEARPEEAEPPAPARADTDPLPAGALVRFGTPRLRHGQAISGVAFSKDSKTLATSSWDRTVSLWQLPSGKEIRRFEGHTAFVSCVALSPDGALLASGGEDFRLWDATTGKELHRAAATPGEVWAVAFSPDGKLAAYGTSNPGGVGAVNVVEAANGKPVAQLGGHTNGVRAVVFSPDGKSLASAGYDNAIRLWDVAGSKQTAQLDGHTGGTLSVAFSADGKALASGSSDGTVRLWDVAAGKETKKFNAEEGKGGGVTGVSFSPDGKLVAACTSATRVVRVYDVAAGKEVHTLPGGWFRCVAFAPDGKTLAAGDGNNAVRLWEMPGARSLNPTQPHESGVHCIAVSPDGKTLAAGTFLKTVHMWDVTTGQPLRRIDGHQHGVYPVAFSPDGRRLATGSRDGTARVWDVPTQRQLHSFLAYDAPRSGDVWVYGLSFAADGKRLAGACRDGRVRVWDVERGKELVRCEGHNAAVWGVAFAPDGKTLVSCGDDAAVRLWDATDGKPVRTLGDPAQYESIAFAPDGRLVAAGARDGTVRLFNPATGRVVHTLKEHANATFRNRLYRDGRTLAFSPDGRMVASGSWQVVQLWEVATGQERLAFAAHRGEVMSVAFLADGRRLATGSPDTTAVVWDLSGCVLDGRPPARVTGMELETLWADLFGNDGHKSYRALWSLTGSPREVLPLLRGRLKPATKVDRDRLARLVKDLDADDFEVREKATDELAKVGGAAEEALRKALEGAPTAEMKQRVELLLGKLQTASASPERTHESRALELLEQLRTPEAREQLRELSRGDPDAGLTREAKGALERAGR
jgi:RNA polymerase sigma factor (sigma-70 family)